MHAYIYVERVCMWRDRVGMPLCLNAPVAMPLLPRHNAPVAVAMLQPPSRNAPTFWNTVVAMLHFGMECPTFVSQVLGEKYALQ